MKALRVTDHGSAARLMTLDLPPPGPGEAQVAIEATALNFADLLMIEGRYQETPPLPFTLGLECAGRVTALGPGTEGPAPGTAVAVFAGQGGLAEAGNFATSALTPIPAGVDMAQAAAVQIGHGTAHLALARRARLQPGERLVVTGAAGGVGLAAVEIGALMGAEVVAIARGADKLALARRAGAHHLIDAEAPDIREQLKALGGIDVAFECVGGDLFRACFRAARPEARLLVIGFAGGGLPEIPANHLLVKNIEVIGVYFGGYRGFAPQVLTGSIGVLLDWIAAGRLAPHVSATLPLDRAAEALALLRDRKATGKVIVTPQ